MSFLDWPFTEPSTRRAPVRAANAASLLRIAKGGTYAIRTPAVKDRRTELGVIYFVFPKDRGFAVVLSQSRYRNLERIDLREHFETRPGDPDTLRPTTKGVSLPVNQLPALRAALEAAERELLERGVLRARHYEKSGVQPPLAQPRE